MNQLAAERIKPGRRKKATANPANPNASKLRTVPATISEVF
ncbi:MAG: hypothetical protein K0R28_3378 [Paenibacillus sp.]|nr:hypothetical protein [Paenibacillus sp.]